MNKSLKYNSSKVETLYKLAQKCSGLNPNENTPPVDVASKKVNEDFNTWNSMISEADTVELIALTGKLSSREDEPSRKIKALRESVISQISFNNTTEINKTMERLDKSARRLTIVSVLLSVIGITIAFLQFFHK